MGTPEILTKAAEVIEERGWYQGGFMPSLTDMDPADLPVCVLAAINVAADHDPDEGFGPAGDRQDAALALAEHLGLRAALDDFEEEGIENVIGNDWNDRPERTAEQVTAALRECAAELSKETTR